MHSNTVLSTHDHFAGCKVLTDRRVSYRPNTGKRYRNLFRMKAFKAMIISYKVEASTQMMLHRH